MWLIAQAALRELVSVCVLSVPSSMSPFSNVQFLHSLSVCSGQNCAQANTQLTLCSNHALIFQSCWNKFVFSKQAL